MCVYIYIYIYIYTHTHAHAHDVELAVSFGCRGRDAEDAEGQAGRHVPGPGGGRASVRQRSPSGFQKLDLNQIGPA